MLTQAAVCCLAHLLLADLQGKKGKTTDRDDQLLAPQTQVLSIVIAVGTPCDVTLSALFC